MQWKIASLFGECVDFCAKMPNSCSLDERAILSLLGYCFFTMNTALLRCDKANINILLIIFLSVFVCVYLHFNGIFCLFFSKMILICKFTFCICFLLSAVKRKANLWRVTTTITSITSVLATAEYALATKTVASFFILFICLFRVSCWFRQFVGLSYPAFFLAHLLLLYILLVMLIRSHAGFLVNVVIPFLPRFYF